MIRNVYSPLAALALVACVGHAPPLVSNEHLTVTSFDALPPPSDAVATNGQRPYRIGPFDTVAIRVFGAPDLGGSFQADSAGVISLPLAGRVEAAGHTPQELEQMIAQRLQGRYVRNPQVTVTVSEAPGRVVTVDGQVVEPGLYPVIGRMTLMQAIARAKGASEFARLQDVVVFRTVGERRMAALYNLSAIRRGVYPDPEIYANDVVIVGDSPARRLFRDLIQAAPLLTTPLVTVLR